MFIVFVHHQCKPDAVDRAIQRIDRNGDMMARIPGFVFRHRTRAKQDPNKISTVTGWNDESAYDEWLKVKAGLPDTGESPFIEVVNERHFVEKSHDHPVPA